MSKSALFTLVVVLSFAFVGCADSGGSWSKGLKEDRNATICGKETVQVPAPENPGMTQPEYRIQLTWDWDDVERGARPMAWSVVCEKTYQMFNISDKVVILPADFGQMKGHVTVLFYWTDDRMPEFCEFKYEYDLPE